MPNRFIVTSSERLYSGCMQYTAAPLLETSRLKLRAFRPDDFEVYAAIWTEPAVTRFIGSGDPMPREVTWSRFLRHVGMWRYLGFGYFALEDKTSGRLIGAAGFQDLHRDLTPSIEGTMEAGWVLGGAAQGKGLAEEAMRALLAWADAAHADKRVTCIIRPDHAASIHVTGKLGFVAFGRCDYFGHEVVLFERCRDGGGSMTDAATINLFSYGTLQLESVQLSSFGRLLDGCDDAMPGWRKDWLEITDPDVLQASGERFHPVVSPSDKSGDEVAGKVFRVTPSELEAADRYEVADYKRIEVVLKSGIGAWVYVKA